jgi:hypothetical protein
LFVPVYLGPSVFDSGVGEIRESTWIRYKEVRSEEGRLCVLSNGFAVWHLTKTMRFKSMSVVARWRQQTYQQILEGRHRIITTLDKVVAGRPSKDLFDSNFKKHGYVLSALVMEGPRISNSIRVRNALQLLASLSALESTVQRRKEEELVLERRILDDGVTNTELHEFGMRGADIGFACWDGVSYYTFDENNAGVIGELVEFEIAVQATWWFAKCVSDVISEPDKTNRSKLLAAVRTLREMFAKLENIGPLDSPSRRTMCEAILTTSRVERLVKETLRRYDSM